MKNAWESNKKFQAQRVLLGNHKIVYGFFCVKRSKQFWRSKPDDPA